jgi:hypothetical protein
VSFFFLDKSVIFVLIMSPYLKLIAGFFFSVLLVQPVHSNTCTSSPGSFASWAAVTWTCTQAPLGGPPVCGDVINIAAGTVVFVGADVDYSACGSPITLNIYGALNFNTNGVQFRLPVNSVVNLAVGGVITKSFPGGGSSTLISVGSTNVWTAGMGTITGPTTLPVELISFTATNMEQGLQLTWKTASETNNSYFTVEKSKDALSYVSVAVVQGAGTSNTENSYSCLDKDCNGGTWYYRLKQTDINGNYSYCKTIVAECGMDHDFSFSIYPNPCKGEDLNLLFTTEEGPKTIRICDVYGKKVYDGIVSESEKEKTVRIDTKEKLQPGIYLFSVSYQKKTYLKKLIVE